METQCAKLNKSARNFDINSLTYLSLILSYVRRQHVNVDYLKILCICMYLGKILIISGPMYGLICLYYGSKCGCEIQKHKSTGLIFEETLLFLRNFALVMGHNFGSSITN